MKKANQDIFNRRQFIATFSTSSLGMLALNTFPFSGNEKLKEEAIKTSQDFGLIWQVGIGRCVITPPDDIGVWLAGYGRKRVAYGKIHDIFAKVLALKDLDGHRIVMVTSDHMGMSKSIYESLYSKLHYKFQLQRSEFMLTFSHNHCGPCLRDDLVDYYPSDEHQKQLVEQYSDWMEDQVIKAVGQALENWQDCQLFNGEGICTFAVNRRENVESEVSKLISEKKSLKGAVDHYVPVLAVKGKGGHLLAVLFGYACHPTTLDFHTWCGDYPGFAQINLEDNHPGTAAMFFNACGADQNPLPRRKLEYCKRYGEMLSDAVEEVLLQPMNPIISTLKSAFEFINLDYEEVVTRKKLLPIANGNSELHARWAKRKLKELDEGKEFSTSYPYPLQAWQIGNELLLLGMGGETVVDYSLRFKNDFPKTTWVCGYANYMAAYIPSRRVWEEGGYEGGPHIDEYGHPAWRWSGDIEDKIIRKMHNVVRQTSK